MSDNSTVWAKPFRCIQTSSLINSCCVCAYSTPCNVNTSRENSIEHSSLNKPVVYSVYVWSLLASTCAVSFAWTPNNRFATAYTAYILSLECNGGKILEVGRFWVWWKSPRPIQVIRSLPSKCLVMLGSENLKSICKLQLRWHKWVNWKQFTVQIRVKHTKDVWGRNSLNDFILK